MSVTEKLKAATEECSRAIAALEEKLKSAISTIAIRDETIATLRESNAKLQKELDQQKALNAPLTEKSAKLTKERDQAVKERQEAVEKMKQMENHPEVKKDRRKRAKQALTTAELEVAKAKKALEDLGPEE